MKEVPNVQVEYLQFDPMKCRVLVGKDGNMKNLPKDSVTTVLPEIEVESLQVNNESSEQEKNVCS